MAQLPLHPIAEKQQKTLLPGPFKVGEEGKEGEGLLGFGSM